jgi:hypothetical protein
LYKYIPYNIPRLWILGNRNVSGLLAVENEELGREENVEVGRELSRLESAESIPKRVGLYNGVTVS